MAGSAFDGINEEGFYEEAKAKFYEEVPDLSQTLNIAVIGKVSSGKSSLINALLRLSRKQAVKIAKVGAVSGVTERLKILKLDEKVCLIDSPGLDDVKKENSKVTEQFLKDIDVGIFVVTGSADASQKANLDQLRQHCKKIFVVINKCDEWDNLSKKAVDAVVSQWKATLSVDEIYLTCTEGYDPQSVLPKMNIRGVAPLRTAIESFLEEAGKDLLLARHMGNKQSKAVKIVVAALILVGGLAFVPGSAAWIAGAQSAAIVKLYYLYKGKILSPEAALAILPTFIAKTAGSSLFLFAKSFLPPTGIVDAAAAAVAITITLAILAAVNQLLASGHELEQSELLQSFFEEYRKQAKGAAMDIGKTDIKDISSISAIVARFLGGRYGIA